MSLENILLYITYILGGYIFIGVMITLYMICISIKARIQGIKDSKSNSFSFQVLLFSVYGLCWGLWAYLDVKERFGE